MMFRALLPLLLVLFMTAACAEAPEENEAGSPATTGRTATAPTTDDIAATETIAEKQSAAAGQAIFMDNGCAMCHSVTSAGVKGMSDAGPDLAGVAARRGGAAGIATFLQSADHPKKWDGPEADLKAVTEWLAGK
jgi:cytochrome c2